MPLTIFHNPRCSKSRKTLEILGAAGKSPIVVEYLKTPPTASELDQLFKKLGKEPQEVMRFGEAIAKELGLAKSDRRPREEWIQLIADNPILLERPIVVHGQRAVIGRPPESVESLF